MQVLECTSSYRSLLVIQHLNLVNEKIQNGSLFIYCVHYTAVFCHEIKPINKQKQQTDNVHNSIVKSNYSPYYHNEQITKDKEAVLTKIGEIG
jgi:hypothetical protein